MDIRSDRLELPYLSSAFPDELLGSWLSRLVILNAEPSLVSFSRAIGLDLHTKSLVADPLNGANYVREISKLLGYEYEAMLASFTTKSYWDTFRPTKTERDSPILLRRTNTPRLSPPMLRVCPACVEDDYQTKGWPYFHRTHQLRSRACPHHRLLLQDSCVCGQVILSSNEPTLFPIRCKCGANLTSALKREEANAAWRTLAEFSHKVLYALPGELNIVHLVPYALSLAVKQKNLSISSSVQRIPVDSYGIDGLEWLCRRPGVQGDGNETRIRTFAPTGLPPHLLVASLASCQIDFNEAKETVAEQSSLPRSARLIPKGARGPRKTFIPKNVSEAKRLASSFTTNLRERGKLKQDRPFVYWMLYLQDWQWLYDWMHESGRRSVACWDKPPDIAEDREIIMNKGTRLARQAARARAYTRDREWLELNGYTRIQAIDRASTILMDLSTNKEQYFAELGRPKKWTIPAAAKRLRMPKKTLVALAYRDERIRAIVPEPSHEYLLRVIDWAITECLKMGISLTPTTVVNTGGLPGSSENMKVIAYAIEKRQLR